MRSVSVPVEIRGRRSKIHGVKGGTADACRVAFLFSAALLVNRGVLGWQEASVTGTGATRYQLRGGNMHRGIPM